MSILSIQRIEVGQVGIKPGRIKVLTTDSLAVVTAAGYFNGANLQGITMGPLDVIEIMYGYNVSAGSIAGWSDFLVTISKGIITVAAAVSAGDVLLPVVAGNLASFSGTTGLIADSGVAASNVVVKPTLPVVSGDIVTFSGTTGAIIDSGTLLTNVMLKNAVNTMAAGSSIVLAKVNGTEAANAVTASGVAGNITTSALTTAGGANYAITWTNTFISATSSVQISLAGGTNTTENITLKCVPGSGTATLTIYNNTAATALNGTIIIAYAVF
jgi:hypothetical protein